MISHNAIRPHIVFGYHGCDKNVGEDILRGTEMVQANNAYDWLGHGYYFWEADPSRAMRWATEARVRHERENRRSNRVRQPYVIGAVIGLGACLDLTTFHGVHILRDGFKSLAEQLQAADEAMPKNVGGEELKGRFLDCAVVNHTCSEYLKKQHLDFDTVRAVFLEGDKLYDNAGFREKTHTQICVRRREAILGFFRIDQPTIEGL